MSRSPVCSVTGRHSAQHAGSDRMQRSSYRPGRPALCIRMVLRWWGGCGQGPACRPARHFWAASARRQRSPDRLICSQCGITTRRPNGAQAAVGAGQLSRMQGWPRRETDSVAPTHAQYDAGCGQSAPAQSCTKSSCCGATSPASSTAPATAGTTPAGRPGRPGSQHNMPYPRRDCGRENAGAAADAEAFSFLLMQGPKRKLCSEQYETIRRCVRTSFEQKKARHFDSETCRKSSWEYVSCGLLFLVNPRLAVKDLNLILSSHW